MIEFVSPTLDYALLAPILIVLGGAVLGVLIEAFAPRKSRASSQLFITLATLVLSLASLISVRDRSSSAAAMESVTFDGAGMLIQGSILLISIIAVFLLADQENFTALAAALPGSDEERASLQQDLRVTEIYPLTLFAVAGMLLFPVATDLITLFVALEVLSLPLYLLAGLSRRRRLMSQEAALKYFARRFRISVLPDGYCLSLRIFIIRYLRWNSLSGNRWQRKRYLSTSRNRLYLDRSPL